jgi:flavin-dependent dehydrogenase
MEDAKKDTAIIGAGVCGLYLAWKLSQKGVNVSVFERKKEIGKQVCSGLFSERILAFVPGSERLIENTIRYAVMHFSKRNLRIDFSKNFFVMEHARLDRMVAEEARRHGADIILGKKIDKLPGGFKKIIGCDGALSQVRNVLNLKRPRMRLGIQMHLKREDHSDFVEVWPTRKGFLWKIPRGSSTEYGIIEEKERAKEMFDDFLRKRSIAPGKIGSALIPQMCWLSIFLIFKATKENSRFLFFRGLCCRGRLPN